MNRPISEAKAEKNSPIKVLHLIDSGGLYGAEKMLLTLCLEQKKQGIKSSILSCGDVGEAEKPLEKEARRLGVDVVGWRMKSGLNLLGILRVLRLAKYGNVDVLHSHGYKFNVLMGLIPKWLHSFKLITTVHGYVQAKKFSAMWLYEVLDRLALRRFDQVVLVSKKMREIPAISNLSESKLSVINNGISSEYIRLDLTEEVLVFRNKFETCLVAVGRLSPEKGFLDLIQAFSLAFKSRASIKRTVGLVIYGEGGLKDDISRNIVSLGLDDNVLLAGYCDDAGAHLANFDALLMPSLTEGLPITLLEAMRAQLPIIASKVGGIPYVLTDKTAYLVNSQDISALANNIIHVAGEAAQAKSKASGAYECFLDLYSSHVMSARYAELYYRLLDLNTNSNFEAAS